MNSASPQAAELDQQVLVRPLQMARPMVVIDARGDIVVWNGAVERLTGRSGREVLGRPLDSIMWQEVPASGGVSSTTSPHLADWMLRTPGGEKVAVQAAMSRASLGEGQAGWVIEVLEERKSPALFETTYARFQQASVPQALLDMQARLTSVNPAWVELFGHPVETLLDQEITTFVHSAAARNVEAELAELRRGDVNSATFELLARHADGRQLSLLLDATLLRDAGGSPRAMAAFARDVTEIKEARDRLSAQQNFYRALNRRSSDAAVVADAELNVIHVSPSVTGIFGYEQEDVLSSSGWDFLHPDDAERLRPFIDSVLAQPDASERFTTRVRDAAGQWRWVETTVTNCLTDPDIGGLVVNLRDITVQVRNRRAMRESEARYRAIVETAQEGILVIASDGSPVFANSKMAQMLGMSVAELLRHDVGRLLGLARPSHLAQIDDRAAVTTVERIYAHPDGGERVLLLSLSGMRTDEEEAAGMLVMASDVTAARHAESELRHKALHDPLTGLPNRYLLADRLEMAAARERRSEGPGTAVMFLDLDRFKVINDGQGHEVGDTVLRAVASRLAGAVRAADTVARLGGDEFAVICEESDRGAAEVVAERIHHALSEPIDVLGHSFNISASIGIAVSPPLQSTELLRRADVAMYQAKEAGGAATVVFDG